MSSPSDLRRSLEDLRAALDGHSRDELQEILTFLFREYVIEKPPPLDITAGLVDTRSELEGVSFAELMTWLQTHLDLPELSLFEVTGGRVSVRVGGRVLPIEPPLVRPESLPLPTTSPAATPTPVPPSTSAPPLSPPPPSAPQSDPPQPAAPSSATQPDTEPTDSSSRFSLLEVD